jgi:hypothetical protein
MVIYVFDERWGGPWKPHRGTNPNDVAVVHVKRTEWLGAIATKIQKAVAKKGQGKRSIWLMHVCGHGNVGVQELGSTDLRAENASLFCDPLAEFMTLKRANEDWMDLKVVRWRGVVLHGCWVASNSVKSHDINSRPLELGRWYPQNPERIGRGRTLLWELSFRLKVPVSAGIDAQVGDAAFTLEGPTITCSPEGTIMDDVTWRRRKGQKHYRPR